MPTAGVLVIAAFGVAAYFGAVAVKHEAQKVGHAIARPFHHGKKKPANAPQPPPEQEESPKQ